MLGVKLAHVSKRGHRSLFPKEVNPSLAKRGLTFFAKWGAGGCDWVWHIEWSK